MINKYYSNTILTILFASLAIATGIYTFGQGDAFDRVYFYTLVGTAFIFRKNTDLLGALCLLIANTLLQELVWGWTELNYSLFLKYSLYVTSLYAIYTLWYDIAAKASLAITIAALASELYWIATGYQSTPEIYWLVFLINCYVVLRHMLFRRAYFWNKYHKLIKATPTVLDYKLETVCVFYIVLLTANLAEYILRHVYGLNTIIVFTAYPYIAQCIGTYAIWLILREYQFMLEKTIIKA